MAAIAAARPAGIARSATTSAARRSTPMTRWPSRVSRSRIPAPIPDADPVTAITPIARASRPEVVDREEVPDELPHFDDLSGVEPQAQARRVVERLAVALAVAAEEGDG